MAQLKVVLDGYGNLIKEQAVQISRLEARAEVTSAAWRVAGPEPTTTGTPPTTRATGAMSTWVGSGEGPAAPLAGAAVAEPTRAGASRTGDDGARARFITAILAIAEREPNERARQMLVNQMGQAREESWTLEAVKDYACERFQWSPGQMNICQAAVRAE